MEPFIGEIRPFPFTFAPQGWLYCNGQLLSINEYSALYALLGTTYGGDGRTTFGLPNLNGRVPMQSGNTNGVVGTSGGAESVSLNSNQIPAHTHALAIAGVASTSSPSGASPAPGVRATYGAANGTLASDSLTNSGNGAAHSNLQPYLVLSYCIAVEGLYPTPN